MLTQWLLQIASKFKGAAFNDASDIVHEQQRQRHKLGRLGRRLRKGTDPLLKVRHYDSGRDKAEHSAHHVLIVCQLL